MRALMSYGLALVIVIVVALWLGSGTLVEGGHGPGLGEKPVVALFDPKAAGAPHKSEEDGPDTPDPFLTIAQREAKTEGAAAPVRSVQVHTFVAQAMDESPPPNRSRTVKIWPARDSVWTSS